MQHAETHAECGRAPSVYSRLLSEGGTLHHRRRGCRSRGWTCTQRCRRRKPRRVGPSRGRRPEGPTTRPWRLTRAAAQRWSIDECGATRQPSRSPLRPSAGPRWFGSGAGSSAPAGSAERDGSSTARVKDVFVNVPSRSVALEAAIDPLAQLRDGCDRGGDVEMPSSATVAELRRQGPAVASARCARSGAALPPLRSGHRPAAS